MGEAPVGRAQSHRRGSRDEPQRPELLSGRTRPGLAVTWLFGGLRSDEIVRLRVGCVRWQPRADGADRVCLLDVPAHKTGAPFTKPVDPLVGQAWEAVRPAQPRLLDLRTVSS